MAVSLLAHLEKGMTSRVDALIFGGGPAGSTAALLLAKLGWSVALLERREFPRSKVCGEYLSGTNRPLLAALGILDEFDSLAGPEVRRVGLFAGQHQHMADLPRPLSGCGRALSRRTLDMHLLDAARTAGAAIHQPCQAESLHRHGDKWLCSARDGQSWQSPTVIAAHGSWDAGSLPTQPPRGVPRPSDLFGFKAHFRNAQLPLDLMPLLSFPGGYGGMVWSSDGCLSVSCCIRRDALTRMREQYSRDAGEAVETHLRRTCRGVADALSGARMAEHWLAAGPIRPGMRLNWPSGIFAVGNAAGEAHPVVAEGISMAMQSAWLLTRRLEYWRHAGSRTDSLPSVAEQYAADWRAAFARRLRASAAIAHWAMSPMAMAISAPVVGMFPPLLTWGARASGKSKSIVQTQKVRA
jgi:flavin-dependent dehydrogenase